MSSKHNNISTGESKVHVAWNTTVKEELPDASLDVVGSSENNSSAPGLTIDSFLDNRGRRMRSANFCESDKLLLINIINGPANSDATTSYVSLIDCKELDKISLERKNAAWAAITRAFNLRSYASRAESQLRMLWKNLKSRNRRFAVTSDDEHFPRSHGTIDDSPISKSRPGSSGNHGNRAFFSSNSFDQGAFNEDEPSIDRIDEASCISGFAQRHAPADDAGGVLSEPGAKRMRAANFCDADKTLLVNILGGPTLCDDTKTYMSVVDCKEIDRSTMDKKNQAWSEVTHAFNANSYVQRSTEQLQSLWKKLKMRAKKCATSDMRQPPFDLLLNGADSQQPASLSANGDCDVTSEQRRDPTRVESFSDAENALLSGVVNGPAAASGSGSASFASIVDCDLQDVGVSAEQKDAAWSEIARAFNSKSTAVSRSAEELRSAWERIKTTFPPMRLTSSNSDFSSESFGLDQAAGPLSPELPSMVVPFRSVPATGLSRGSAAAGTNTDTQALSTVSDPPASSLNDGAVESTARLRDVNFCEADKSLLVNIMNGPTFGNGAISYFSVICSREIDRVTMEKKSQAWSEITQVFNSRSLVPRRTRQLRLLWKKLRMRSNNAGHRALVSSRRFEFANRRNAFSRSSGFMSHRLLRAPTSINAGASTTQKKIGATGRSLRKVMKVDVFKRFNGINNSNRNKATSASEPPNNATSSDEGEKRLRILLLRTDLQLRKQQIRNSLELERRERRREERERRQEELEELRESREAEKHEWEKEKHLLEIELLKHQLKST